MHIHNKPRNYSLRKAYSEKLRNFIKGNENKTTVKKKLTKGPVSSAVKNNNKSINQDPKKSFNNSKNEIDKVNNIRVESLKCNCKTAEDCENDKKLEGILSEVQVNKVVFS